MPTLSELRAIVRQDETLNSADVIADADLNTLLNEAAVQFARDGHPYIVTGTWNTAASTSKYVLSGASAQVSGFLEVYWPTGGVQYTDDSSVVRLAPNDFTVVSEQWLNREVHGWQALSASDSLQHVYFGFNSSGYFVLGTVPAASTTTPSFKLWFLSRGTDMSADANYPYTNDTNELTHLEPYLKALAYWSMYVLHRDKTKINSESDRYLQLYTSLAQQCRDAQLRIFNAEASGLREEGRLTATQTFGSI